MDERGQGGLTGATGSLTPDGSDDEFVPAETREMIDPRAAHRVTVVAHQRAEARHARQEDVPGRLIARGANTAPNDRDGGYGSEHGLAAGDPAYREEAAPPSPAAHRRPGGRIELGGDEHHDPEEEHF